MPSFKVPCPSCEAPVLIKNPDLVGKKVECPKCKYRFKVEAPAADADAAAAADAKDAKKGDAKDKEKEKDKKADGKKAKAAGGKNKKLVPILVGVGAVVVLAVVGFVAFGGSGKKGGGFVGSGGPPGGPKGGGSTGDGTDETGGPPPAKGGPVPEPIPFSKANTTNLLPGQAAAVYRFNMDRVRESPAHGALVDSQVRTLFRDSMGFELEEVETYLHCFAGADRAAFGVIKLKTPTKPADVAARLTLQPKPKAVKGRNLHAVRSNPFVNAVSHALAMRSLLGEVYDRLPAPPPAKANAQPLGLCVYDTQHVLIGDYALLEKFLGELDADGYPPFKTVMNTPTAAPPPPTMPGVPMGTPMGTAPTPPAPPAPAPAGAGGDKPFTSIDAYRTVEPPLKKALDAMEADKLRVPLVVYAEKFDSKQYDPAQMKESYSALKEALAPIAARTLYLSGNVVTFSQRQLVANLRITLPPGAAEDARTIAKDQLGPGLTTVAGLLKLSLTVPVEVRDYTKGGTATDAGIPGSPGMMGTGPYPGMFEGSPGPGMLPGGRPGVGAFPSGPGDMGPGPGKPGGFPGPGGPPAGLPGMSSFPPGMGEMGPGVTPGFEDPDRVKPLPVSHLDLGMIDTDLLIGIDLTWDETIYRTKIAPRLVSVTNQIKGKMAVFSSDFSWHALAAAGPKAAEGPGGMFPRGTADRKGNADRYGLAYPPSSRVSLFADLLPYLGRGGLEKSLRKDLAWYDPHNLPAPGNDRAGAWVPELLVPDYPQSAWRATSPLAPDHVLGATNYVAIAGRGLNIARENPNDPAFKTKVGITGYGWGSKPEEVTDGLSNTIYMMQTPPGLQQPWIAGGGATVRGLDEVDPMGTFKYPQRGRTKEGSYALMADGSVRFIPADIDPQVLLAMSTRAGGEALTGLNGAAPKVEPPKPAVEAKPDPVPKLEPKPAEPKKPEDKKPDAKPEDKKPVEPKKAEDKKEPDPKAKGADAAPAPKEK